MFTPDLLTGPTEAVGASEDACIQTGADRDKGTSQEQPMTQQSSPRDKGTS